MSSILGGDAWRAYEAGLADGRAERAAEVERLRRRLDRVVAVAVEWIDQTRGDAENWTNSAIEAVRDAAREGDK